MDGIWIRGEKPPHLAYTRADRELASPSEGEDVEDHFFWNVYLSWLKEKCVPPAALLSSLFSLFSLSSPLPR